jgi:hypothetical protein
MVDFIVGHVTVALSPWEVEILSVHRSLKPRRAPNGRRHSHTIGSGKAMTPAELEKFHEKRDAKERAAAKAASKEGSGIPFWY